ncbi:efflux RND transporter periplasmic adaptor subunit [Novosphingobium sp.]|uniref:efflux RND transporter periplasmic adaptor subunit n=1 Tax=Novosphingobium sp. TaxID=1874826 RepID=UPI002622059B|nr:efflux RND transporter periplasmic adaptor subunit [Novosphingobium sp.]
MSNIGELYSSANNPPTTKVYADRMNIRIVPIALLTASLLAACGSDPASAPKAPVKSEAVAHETELVRLELTPEAQKRLGIALETVGKNSVETTRMTSGEIVVPGAIGGAPINAATNLQQLATLQVAADGELARAQAQLQLARIAYNRAAVLVKEDAGSIRARDEATAALGAAKAAADAATAQRRLLGPAVATLSNQRLVWVRVPVFGSDLQSLGQGQSALVSPLGHEGAKRSARPVDAPPSANAVAGTVDLYFSLDNRDRAYRVGQRVSVALPLANGRSEGLSVPTTAILRDIYGGEWVYAKTETNTFVRQRIEVAATDGGRAILSRGLRPGMAVVTAGAAELFGTEFGVAH